MQKLKEALRIDDKHEFGAAFDLELQETKRLGRLADREKDRKEKKRAKREARKLKEKEDLKKELLKIKDAPVPTLVVAAPPKEKK